METLTASEGTMADQTAYALMIPENMTSRDRAHLAVITKDGRTGALLCGKSYGRRRWAMQGIVSAEGFKSCLECATGARELQRDDVLMRNDRADQYRTWVVEHEGYLGEGDRNAFEYPQPIGPVRLWARGVRVTVRDSHPAPVWRAQTGVIQSAYPSDDEYLVLLDGARDMVVPFSASDLEVQSD